MTPELISDYERETKNTARFQERETTEAPVLGTLYLHKYALRKLGDPQELRVNVERTKEEG